MCGFVRLRSAAWLALTVIAVSPAASRADQSDPAIIEHVQAPWTGDFDQMVERQMIRVLTVFSQTMYFLDGADQKASPTIWSRPLSSTSTRHSAPRQKFRW
jgi:hypothetical protein